MNKGVKQMCGDAGAYCKRKFSISKIFQQKERGASFLTRTPH